jgi:ABC-type transporter Mla subunit MlaD
LARSSSQAIVAIIAHSNAIEALVAVSSQAVEQVQQAKTTLIARLKAQQSRLIRLYAEEGDEVSGDAFREERARLQTEIHEAERSLAETEQRLGVDADMLRVALELAEDVAAVYAQADEQTKRGYNQAFFKKLRVAPEWDEERGEMVARITNRADGALCSSSGREAGARGARRGRADPLRPLERRGRPRRVGLWRVFYLPETGGGGGVWCHHTL